MLCRKSQGAVALHGETFQRNARAKHRPRHSLFKGYGYTPCCSWQMISVIVLTCSKISLLFLGGGLYNVQQQKFWKYSLIKLWMKSFKLFFFCWSLLIANENHKSSVSDSEKINQTWFSTLKYQMSEKYAHLYALLKVVAPRGFS